MSEEISYNIKIDTKSAVNDVDALEKKIGQFRNTFNEAKKLIEQGLKTNRSKFNVEGFGNFTVKQLEKEIQSIEDNINKLSNSVEKLEEVKKKASKKGQEAQSEIRKQQAEQNRIQKALENEQKLIEKHQVNQYNKHLAKAQKKYAKTMNELTKLDREMQGLDKDSGAYSIASQRRRRLVDRLNDVLDRWGNNKQFSAYRKEIDDKLASSNISRWVREAKQEEAQVSKLLSEAKARNARYNDAQYYRDKEQAGKDFSRALQDKMNADVKAGLEKERAAQRAAIGELREYTRAVKNLENIKRALTKTTDKESAAYKEAAQRADNLQNKISSIRDKYKDDAKFQEYDKKLSDELEQKRVLDGLKGSSQSISQGGSHSSSNRVSSYSNQIAKLRRNMENLHMSYKRGDTVQEQYIKKMDRYKSLLDKLTKNQKEFKKAIGETSGMFEHFGAKVKSHLHWIIAGEFIHAVSAIPMAIQNITVEFDSLERKIAQNLELSDQFVGQHHKLKEATKGLMRDAGLMANEYGLKVEDTMQMMQIMSRRFKDPDELVYFTDLAAIMAKLDFVDPAVAAETLESIILSFGLTTKEASKFVDQFSVATHIMRINGQDLLEALQRSAPMLKSWGLNTAEATALISTLSTSLGREGKYIGTALSGLFSRILNPTNLKKFEQLGISMTVLEDGAKRAKTGIEILKEYHERLKTLSKEAQKEEVNSIFGAYRFTPSMSILQTFELFEKSLNNINSLASRDKTLELLRMRTEAYESQITNTSNSLKILANTLGDDLVPLWIWFLEKVEDSANALDNFITNNNDLFHSILRTILGLTALKTALIVNNWWTNKFGSSIANLTTIMKALGIAMNAPTTGVGKLTGGFLGFVGKVGLIVGKFALITGAVWALTEGIYALYNAIDKKNTVDEMSKAYQEKYTGKMYLEGYRKASDESVFAGAYEEYLEKQKASDSAQAEAARAKLNVARFEESFGNTDSIEYQALLETQYQKEAIAAKKAEEAQNAFNFAKIAHEQENRVDNLSKYQEKVEEIGRKKANKTYIDQIGAGDGDPWTIRDENGNPISINTGKEKEKETDAEKKARIALNTTMALMKSSDDKTKKDYTGSLSELDFNDEVFGVTVESVSKRLATKLARKNTLAEQIKSYKTLRDKTKKEYLFGEDEYTIEHLEELANDNSVSAQKYKTQANLQRKVAEMEERIQAAEEETKQVSREIKKAYMIPPEKQWEEAKKRIKVNQDIETIDSTNKRNAFNNTVLLDVKLKYSNQNLEVLEKELEAAKEKVKDFEAELQKAREEQNEENMKIYEYELQKAQDVEKQKVLAVKQAKQEILNLEYEKTKKIRDGLYDITNELLLQGKSWHDIWNTLWNDLAQEALRALMGVEDGGQSTLGAIMAQVFGLNDKDKKKVTPEKQQEVTNLNTDAVERNTVALDNVAVALNGKAPDGSPIEKPKMEVEIPKGELDTKKDEINPNPDDVKKNNDLFMTTAVLGGLLSMSGSKTARRIGALLSIASPFMKGKKVSHSGSIVGVTPMATKYFHNGGTVGTSVVPYLKSDEVNAVLQTGEEVVSRKDRRSNELMAEQNKYMTDAMQRMSENTNNHVTFAIQAIDAKSVVQLLNENGDAIMNILRKQSAYGNGGFR